MHHVRHCFQFITCFFYKFCFILVFFILLYLFCFWVCSKNSKNHKNWKIFKNFDRLCYVYHMWVWPSTFVLIAYCIYELSLLCMHIYLCGRNLEICVIVVNRSSSLSWMIGQQSWWSWYVYRLVLIYLPTFIFMILL